MSQILKNVQQGHYERLFETLVVGSVFAVLGPKFVEYTLYPIANRAIAYKKPDEYSTRIEYAQVVRLLLITGMVLVMRAGLVRAFRSDQVFASPKVTNRRGI